jgi:Protein of unknown function (DUF2621)
VNWNSEAREIVSDLLLELPAPVRDQVRQSAEYRAEALAEDGGLREVPVEVAVRAFIEATPADLRQRLKHTLNYRGIDPDDYDEAFTG